MSVIFLVVLCVPAFAAEENGTSRRIDFAASMQIVSFAGGGLGSSWGIGGHTFLIFTNIGDSEITVGHMPVGIGESITIGTYGNRSAHQGIW